MSGEEWTVLWEDTIQSVDTDLHYWVTETVNYHQTQTLSNHSAHYNNCQKHSLDRRTSFFNKQHATYLLQIQWFLPTVRVSTVALMVRCSVRLSVTFCIVAKRYVVEGWRWYRWIWALVNSYRLSIVTMSLTAAVWPQFATQVFRGGTGRLTCIGSYVNNQGTKFTFRVQATCSKHHTRTVMDAGCEYAPWVRSANPSDSWALVYTNTN